MELLAERGDLFGHGSREVILFAQVIAQVEQLDPHILEPFDELEVARAHRATGAAALVAVVGVMPEEGAFWPCAALEERNEADAVHVLLWPQRQPGNFQEGGIVIGADHRRAANAARLPPPAGPEFLSEGKRQIRQVQNQPVYAAMVHSLDESVGRIIQKLAELGLQG